MRKRILKWRDYWCLAKAICTFLTNHIFWFYKIYTIVLAVKIAALATISLTQKASRVTWLFGVGHRFFVCSSITGISSVLFTIVLLVKINVLVFTPNIHFDKKLSRLTKWFCVSLRLFMRSNITWIFSVIFYQHSIIWNIGIRTKYSPMQKTCPNVVIIWCLSYHI